MRRAILASSSLLMLSLPAQAQNSWIFVQQEGVMLDQYLSSRMRSNLSSLRWKQRPVSDPDAFISEALNQSASNWVIPSWEMYPVELSGPTEQDGVWSVDTSARLQLGITIVSQGGQKRLNRDIILKKSYPLSDMEHIRAVVEEATGQSVDLDLSSGRDLVLTVLKEAPEFQAILEENPYVLFSDEIEREIKVLPLDFIKADLGVETEKPTLSNDNKRVRVPGNKVGFLLGTELGSRPLNLLGYAPFYFDFGGDLVLGYDLGQHFNFPEMYLTVGGGAAAPVPGFNFQQPAFGGGFGGGIPINPTTSVMAWNAEMGLSKFFKLPANLALSLDLRLGALGGIAMDPTLFPAPSSLSVGVTAQTGIHYEFIDGLRAGLKAGWRYYPESMWLLNGIAFQQLPALGSNGPVLNFNLQYTF